MNKLTQEQLDAEYVVTDDFNLFRKYSGLRDWVNSKLDTNFKAVLCTRKLTLDKRTLDFSGEKIMLVKQDLSYVIISNSEWASIKV